MQQADRHPYKNTPPLPPSRYPSSSNRQFIRTAIFMLAGGAFAAPGVANSAEELATQQDDDALDTVVVRARNRDEKLQEVPVPVSVISGKSLEREGAVTFGDFANRAAGITVNEQNARQSSISIRGLGKQGATDGLEASVGTIVDNVFQGYSAMSWGDFVDLDRVEILRGPQGTLLGKNTTLGVVNVYTKLPSFKSENTFETTLGTRDSIIAKGSSTGAIQDGVLAYRASLFVDKRDGSISNIYPNGQTWYDKNRLGARLQFLLTPTESLSARIILSHQESEENVNGSLQVSDPTTYLDGTPRTGQSFTSRLARVQAATGTTYSPPYGQNRFNVDYVKPLKNKQDGISTEINLDINGYLLTSITAYNDLGFNARNDNDATPYSVAYNFNTDATYHQFTQELRFTSPTGGLFDYQIGVFGLDSKINTNQKSQFGDDAGAWYANNAQFSSLNADSTGRQLLRDSLDTVYTVSNQQPSTRSLATFGQLNWNVDERTKVTLGARQTYEKRDNSIDKRLVNGGTRIAQDDATAQRYFGTNLAALNAAQRAQLTNAIAIRDAQVGSLFDRTDGDDIKENSTSWLLNPSYKLNRNVLLYASVGYGEKSGASLFNTSNGTPVTVKPERAINGELGFKSTLLNNALLLNVNLFQTTVRDYQQSLQKVDASTATGYRSELGNVDEVQLRGVEFDAAYTGIRHWTFRLAGAYNHSIYKSFANATCNPETTATPAAVCDFSGKQLPGSSRFSFNLGVAHSIPITRDYELRTTLNNSYRSSNNTSATLSEYGEQKAYNVTDASIGIARLDGKYEVSLIAKNLFDTRYSLGGSAFSSTAPVSYRPGDSRFVGITFRMKI